MFLKRSMQKKLLNLRNSVNFKIMKNIIKQQIRKEMYTNIRSYNRHLPMETLVKMSFMALLSNTHPIERAGFVRHLEKENIIKLTPKQHLSLFGRTNPLRHKAI